MNESEWRAEGERVQFTCMDCGTEVDREPNDMDIPGLTPRRCPECVAQKMGEDE